MYKKKLSGMNWRRPIQGNRNPLLYKNFGADGIKTGYLAVEKYSLASSIKRKERRLIAVGSGFNTKNSRSRQSAKLPYGLTNFDTVKILDKTSSIGDVEVWQGKIKYVKSYADKDIYKSIPKARKKYLKVILKYDGPIHAPIEKNQILGKIQIFYKDEFLEEHDLLAFENVKRLNIFSRILTSINFLIWGDV